MLREEDLNLAAAYALGVIDPADLAVAEKRLATGDAEFVRAVAEFGDAAALIAHTAPVASQAPAMRGRLLELAASERPDPLAGSLDAPTPAPPIASVPPPVASAPTAAPTGAKSPSAPSASSAPAAPVAPVAPVAPKVIAIQPHLSIFERWGAGFAAAAAVLAVVSTVLGVQQAGLRKRVDVLEEHSRAVEGQVVVEHERGRWLDVWGAPHVQLVTLGATANGVPQFGGRGAYDPATQRAVLVFDHASAPAGRDFQLWAIRPDGPASLGLVKAAADGRAEIRIEQIGDPGSLTAFAVSLEPAGGSPQPTPTGPVVLVGRLPG